jgi:hypothetical protein
MRRKIRAAAAITALVLASTALWAAEPGDNTLYCESALDVGGIFCAIGCPNECSCTFGRFVSQCCCQV